MKQSDKTTGVRYETPQSGTTVLDSEGILCQSGPFTGTASNWEVDDKNYNWN